MSPTRAPIGSSKRLPGQKALRSSWAWLRYPPYLKGEGGGDPVPQFHVFSPPRKRENGTLNGIPGVTLPQFQFEGGGDAPLKANLCRKKRFQGETNPRRPIFLPQLPEARSPLQSSSWQLPRNHRLEKGNLEIPSWHVAVGQSPALLVNIKIGGTWVFIRPKMEA